MTEYVDSFNKKTIVELIPYAHDKSVGFVLNKGDSRTMLERWELKIAKQVLQDLQIVVEILEKE